MSNIPMDNSSFRWHFVLETEVFNSLLITPTKQFKSIRQNPSQSKPK